MKYTSLVTNCFTQNDRFWSALHLTALVLQYLPVIVSYCTICGPGSSVSIATGYGLDGTGTNLPKGGGVRLSAPVHTAPGTHQVSCTMGTVSFLVLRAARA